MCFYIASENTKVRLLPPLIRIQLLPPHYQNSSLTQYSFLPRLMKNWTKTVYNVPVENLISRSVVTMWGIINICCKILIIEIQIGSYALCTHHPGGNLNMLKRCQATPPPLEESKTLVTYFVNLVLHRISSLQFTNIADNSSGDNALDSSRGL